jgi:tryptophan-rich sensory protein
MSMRKVAMICGLVEAFGLSVFAMSVLLKEASDNGVRGSGPHPLVLFVIFQIFAVAIAIITRALWRRNSWAKTPFGLIQVFALLVFAYLPLNGSGQLARLGGALVAVVSLTALFALIKIRSEN